MKHHVLLASALFFAGAVAGTVGQTPTYTHYVTPDGISTGVCSEFSPCNLWRAAQLANAAGAQPMSFRVGAGFYSPSQLTLSGNGHTFTFEPGAALVGTRDKPAEWALTEGYPNVYETAWPDTAPGYVVNNVAQRNPTPWRPIRVIDGNRDLTIDKPVKFKRVWSRAEAQAQAGTFFHSGADDRLYIHTYHDGAPTPEDDIWIGPANLGSLVITGDNNTFVGLEQRNVMGNAIDVKNSANNTTFRGATFTDAQIWLRGIDTVLEDSILELRMSQGVPSHWQCRNPNDFGIGLCFNAYGDGRALLLGEEGRPWTYRQIVRRVHIRNSWNGARIDGHNTIEDSRFQGFPNHALQATGNGVVIRNNVMLNGQDSLFIRGVFSGEILNNIFLGAVYVTNSNNGVGGAAGLPWTVRGNMLPAFTVDSWAYSTLTSDCNVYLEAPGVNLFRVLTTNGVPGFTVQTLADLQARNGQDMRSRALQSSSLSSGRFFERYTNQADTLADFSDPLKVCGERVGPRGGTE
jgi:hypothetical protein